MVIRQNDTIIDFRVSPLFLRNQTAHIRGACPTCPTMPINGVRARKKSRTSKFSLRPTFPTFHFRVLIVVLAYVKILLRCRNIGGNRLAVKVVGRRFGDGLIVSWLVVIGGNIVGVAVVNFFLVSIGGVFLNSLS